MKRITIREIAKQAGVSIGTVDRVLHKRGEVSKKTAALVERIAREGNYKANVIARGLKIKSRNKIAVLLPNDNEYWQMLNRGITQEVNEVAGFGMSVTSFAYDRHNAHSFNKQALAMMASRPDGVIMAPILENESDKICKQLSDNSIPYMFVDSTLKSAKPVAFIGQDSERAGYLAAKLLTIGFPEGCPIYIVLINDFDSVNKTIDERVAGLKKYVAEKQLEKCIIYEIGLDNNFSALVDEAKKIGAKGELMNIFVPNSRACDIGEALKFINCRTRIVGFDLIEKNREALASGRIDFVIDQNPERQGSEVIRAFYKLNVAKEEVADVKMSLTIYTGENI